MVGVVAPRVEALLIEEHGEDMWPHVVAEPPPWDAGALAFVVHKHWRSVFRPRVHPDVEGEADFLVHFCKRRPPGRVVPLGRASDAVLKAGKLMAAFMGDARYGRMTAEALQRLAEQAGSGGSGGGGGGGGGPMPPPPQQQQPQQQMQMQQGGPPPPPPQLLQRGGSLEHQQAPASLAAAAANASYQRAAAVAAQQAHMAQQQQAMAAQQAAQQQQGGGGGGGGGGMPPLQALLPSPHLLTPDQFAHLSQLQAQGMPPGQLQQLAASAAAQNAGMNHSGGGGGGPPPMQQQQQQQAPPPQAPAAPPPLVVGTSVPLLHQLTANEPLAGVKSVGDLLQMSAQLVTVVLAPLHAHAGTARVHDAVFALAHRLRTVLKTLQLVCLRYRGALGTDASAEQTLMSTTTGLLAELLVALTAAAAAREAELRDLAQSGAFIAAGCGWAAAHVDDVEAVHGALTRALTALTALTQNH